MVDRETTIIPLDVAHEVFSTFGIGPDCKEYQRWRREDGFRLVDLEDVLGESQAVLRVDWREWLQDAINTILEQLGAIGISATSDLGEEGEQGYIEVDGRREAIKYVPNDDDDFDKVIQSINVLITATALYRRFRSCVGSDGWVYGLLSNENWKELESNATETTKILFLPN